MGQPIKQVLCMIMCNVDSMFLCHLTSDMIWQGPI